MKFTKTLFALSIIILMATLVASQAFAKPEKLPGKKVTPSEPKVTEIVAPKDSMVNDDGITRIAGFGIGDSAQSAADQCSKGLGYVVEVGMIQPGLFGFVCEPESKSKVKNNNKPDAVMLLILEDKIVGIHTIYTSKLAYKKALVNFITSAIIEDEKIEVSQTLPPVTTYINSKEGWIGWYYVEKAELDKEQDTTTDLYMIHVEKYTKEEAKKE